MSSYRSYTSWKSNLGSSYKPGSSSTYASRDDVTSTRFGSLASPSSYRTPSFSGGTYRIKRDLTTTPHINSSHNAATTPYVSRYGSTGSGLKNEEKINESSAAKSPPILKYSNANTSASNKESSVQLKRYSTATTNVPRYGRSREPSPANLPDSSSTRVKSREPSPPSLRVLRAKSRDPSPAIDSKSKIAYGNHYRLSSTPRISATSYASRYVNPVGSKASTSTIPDKSISYLSASDFRARSISRAREISQVKESVVTTSEDNETVQPKDESEIPSDAESGNVEGETFESVVVVTRATSPTPPGSSLIQRARRIDIAKTIEKTIKRSTKKKKTLEKEIQSDRLDDSTRYSRFGLSSRVSPYSSHTEGRYSASSSQRYNASPLSITSKSISNNNETKKEDSSKRVTNSETKILKSKLSSPKAGRRTGSRQPSVENLSAMKSLPPTAPKAESPTKSSSSGSTSPVKWPNKDFRKSALNVGPTDRPRKSRTPSTGTESDGIVATTLNGPSGIAKPRKERSPSACSETSNASTSNNNINNNNNNNNNKKNNEIKIRQRCHPKIVPAATVSRHNSNLSIKSNAHKACHPSGIVASSTSSSGTESASENSKSMKQKKINIKKKISNSGNANNCNNKIIGNSVELKAASHAENVSDANKMPSNSLIVDQNNTNIQSLTICLEESSQAGKNTCKPSSDRELQNDSLQGKNFSEVGREGNASPSYSINKLPITTNICAPKFGDIYRKTTINESCESSTESGAHSIGDVSLKKDFETKTQSIQANENTTETNTLKIVETSTNEQISAISKSPTTRSFRETNPSTASSEDRSVTDPHYTADSDTSTKSDISSKTTKDSDFHSNNTTASHRLSNIDLSTETFAVSSASAELQESFWEQDSSCQTSATSATFDSENHYSAMRYNLRHIDSGEIAWWQKSDEEDTLADDDIKTLNQEDEDLSLSTDGFSNFDSLPNSSNSAQWAQDDDAAKNQQFYAKGQTENNIGEAFDKHESKVQKDLTDETNFSEKKILSEDWNITQRNVRSRYTPEAQWWEGDSDNDGHALEKETEEDCSKVSKAEKTENVQARIFRDESGERAWWLVDDDKRSRDITFEASANLKTGEDSLTAQNKLDCSTCTIKGDENHWWMKEPSKKLSNIKRVESGEKAWWQQDEENNTQRGKINSARKGDSTEKAWWEKEDDDVTVKSSQIQRDNDVNNEGESNDLEIQRLINKDSPQIEKTEIRSVSMITNSNSNSHLNHSFNNNYVDRPPPLGHRASPDGLEDPMLTSNSQYNNIPTLKTQNHPQHLDQRKRTQNDKHYQNQSSKEKLFISRHKNIDEVLGGSCRPFSPLFCDSNTFPPDSSVLDTFLEEITPDQVKIHDSTPQMPVIQRMGRDEWDYNDAPPQFASPVETHELDDAAIQVYKDGDYGAYLDLESSLAEQSEEIDGLVCSRKNSLVVRTQLSVRVHAIIEKLLSAEGSDLRRALFSLKQVFQEDKDLVHAFVALGGLNCLVRVGNGADQNYQNYILRALGQVMLYVDGMNGVMKHEPTMQWLYSLIASKYRSVVKTALKLLLVFVEYAETNCYVLVNAIHTVDKSQGTLPWSNIMRLLKDYDNADTELVIYATSLINKTLAGLTDQDSFYDESDLLEQQGMESVISRYISKPGTDLDLLDQLQLYEAVLRFEDGEADGLRLPNNSLRKTQRCRQNGNDTIERRKSRRHSTGATSAVINKVIQTPKKGTPAYGVLDEDSSGSANSNEFSNGTLRDQKMNTESSGVTPSLRRRRERAERHKSFLKEQQEAAANGFFASLEKREEMETGNEDKKLLLQLQRDHTVKDLTQKLSSIPTSPTHGEIMQNRIVGDMSGLISKAKEGLAKSKSKGEIARVDQDIKKVEPKKSENELHWEELVRNMVRPLNLCDLDFTDLTSDDEKDMLAPRGLGCGIPPPPPPFGAPPPLLPTHSIFTPLANQIHNALTSSTFSSGGQAPSLNNSFNSSISGDAGNTSTIKKNKKTVKLFWKEVREDMIPVSLGKTIWDELPAANVDTQKLEHLFESRAKDLMTKEKQQELNKSKEVIVLDHKRSNAINIAMTKLPPPRAIKGAILKMDATVVTREGIDKLLNLLPTDEERGKIQEAQMANPELPLGSAEQFLLTLASISELSARLRLWAFRLDFDNSEKEIAEPLMDLKQGIEILRTNHTFKCILSTLLSVGIFLNGAPVKGFQIEYLSKVPEVKDTVHKHSLLHHLCHMVMETSNDTTDLYSEIGPITRASKADFADLAHNLNLLETECKASWDRLKLIAKHDCPPQLKQKLVDFLADCAERIIILQIVHRRVINRYRKFLLWLGVPQHSVCESKPNEFCRIVSEFALEYRTTRERVQQQIEKKANHRERNKTRGKMIIDVGKFKTKEDRADAELKELLGTPSPGTVDGTLTWRRRRAEQLRSPTVRQSEENFTDGDDEILESLVKTATKAPGTRTTPRERKRTRHADRKSLKRSRTREGFTAEKAPSSLQ